MGEPSMILVVLAADDETMYSDVKWWADCLQGVPTACVTANTVRKETDHGKVTNNGDWIHTTDANLLGNIW
jgi:hypothetical protein